jgi:hypothetical protein
MPSEALRKLRARESAEKLLELIEDYLNSELPEDERQRRWRQFRRKLLATREAREANAQR